MRIIHTIRENKIRIVFALLLLLVLVIDVRRNITAEAVTKITNQMLGLGVSLAVCGCYGFRKLWRPYFVSAGLLGIAGAVFGLYYWFGHQTAGLVYLFVMTPLNVGFLLISWGLMAEHYFLRKEEKFRLEKWEIAAFICVLGMVLSVNDDFWPAYHLLMMVPLWHAPLTREQKAQALDGMMDGVILGFFLIQSFAYYNRPYDEVRYLGSYHGSNINALFYLMVLASIIGKYFLSRLRYRKEQSKIRKFWIVWHWLFMAGLVDFILFTMGRTALAVAGVMILLLGIVGELRVLRDKFGWVALRAVLFGFAVMAGVPLVYWTIRYIPAYCDHPLYFSDEWSEDKVQPRSAVDDPRYVTLEEALEAMIGRIVGPDGFIRLSAGEDPSSELTSGNPVKLVSLGEVAPEPVQVSPEDMDTGLHSPDGPEVEGYLWAFEATMLYEGEGATVDYSGIYGYKYLSKPANYSAWARLVIYKLYASNLNLIGHKMVDSCFVVSDFPIYHGHNLLLEYMYLYGIPAGGLFVVLLILAAVRSRLLTTRRRPEAFVCLLYYLIHLGYGVFECVFFPGQAVLFFSFFLPFFLMGSTEEYLPEEKETVTE